MNKGTWIAIGLFMFAAFAQAQQHVTTFGFLIRPSFPSQFFRTGPKDFSGDIADFSVIQRSGISYGGLVRRGVTKRLTLETGLIYTKRNYDMSLSAGSLTSKGSYSVIGYQMPVSSLIFIQLTDNLWMSAGLGGSVDYFPSDVFTFGDYYVHYSARQGKVNASALASLGVEWRTKKSGYFYLGATYNRNFSPIYRTLVEYYATNDYTEPFDDIGRTNLEGDYFGIDFRYYFHEDPEKKKARKSKKK